MNFSSNFIFFAITFFLLLIKSSETSIEQRPAANSCYGQLCHYRCLMHHVTDFREKLCFFIDNIEPHKKKSIENANNFRKLNSLDSHMNYGKFLDVIKQVLIDLKILINLVVENNIFFGFQEIKSSNRYEKFNCSCVMTSKRTWPITIRTLNSLIEAIERFNAKFNIELQRESKSEWRTDEIIKSLMILLDSLTQQYNFYEYFNQRFLKNLNECMTSDKFGGSVSDTMVNWEFFSANLFIKKNHCLFDASTMLLEEVFSLLNMEFVDIPFKSIYDELLLEFDLLSFERPFNFDFFDSGEFRAVYFNQTSTVSYYGEDYFDSYFVCMCYSMSYRFYMLQLQETLQKAEVGICEKVIDDVRHLTKYITKNEINSMQASIEHIFYHAVKDEIERLKHKFHSQNSDIRHHLSCFRKRKFREVFKSTFLYRGTSLLDVYLWLKKNMNRFVEDLSQVKATEINVIFGFISMLLIRELEKIEKIWLHLFENIQEFIQAMDYEKITETIKKSELELDKVWEQDVMRLFEIFETIWFKNSPANDKDHREFFIKIINELIAKSNNQLSH